ncbi:MAG: type II toxin-antitoxin system HicA family toxin [Dehalococcoidia bacterium]
MPDRIPRLRADEVVRILRSNGFVLVSQRGSHQKWRNADTRH